ncbi:MAG: helix-turn-helix transcriptional regulator [Oscillospiraceae bacterium]|nr:helix-turn-helix transcriptional regulator [Oscillospiraceae bacterium]
MAKKVGTLIKEARTEAGMTQEQLARKIKGLSAADISKAERGEMELTQAALKEIAKATGVTQKSLLDAAKGSSTAKKKSSTSSGSKKSMQVTATEKKLVELYREADSDTKKTVMAVLKGEKSALLGAAASSLLSEGSPAGDFLGSILGDGKGEAGDALGSILDMLGKAK